MNEKNLRPLHQSNEEATRNGKKGGIASGKSRRRKRALKQIACQLLDHEVVSEDTRSSLSKFGFDDEEMTNAAVLILSTYKEACHGNMRAVELLIRISGEDPDQKRKDDELKLKRELIKQQTIKLRQSNYSDNDDLDWILRYHPDNNAEEPWRQIALLEIAEAIDAGKDPEALANERGSWLENYVTRRIADYLIKDKQKKLKKEGYEAAKDTDIEELPCE